MRNPHAFGTDSIEMNSEDEFEALSRAVRLGTRDENELSDLIFFKRHPERDGRSIRKGERDFKNLSQEWIHIRDKVVRPFLATPPEPDMEQDLADLQAKAKDLWENRSRGEERGKGRDELVAGIRLLRENIAALDKSGGSADTVTTLSTRMYRAIHDLAPFYAQSTNVDLLEGKVQAKKLGTKTSYETRTCNITATASAIEFCGRSSADYSGSQRKIQAVARLYSSEISTAKMTVGSKVNGLRLPDFLQLAAIAECLGSDTSAEAVTAATVKAWEKILIIGFLKKLASRFGVSASVKLFTTELSNEKKTREDETKRLRSYGKKHRRKVERLVDARNKAEASGSPKDKAAYHRWAKKLEAALSGKGIEDEISIEAYKNAVISQIGEALDSGHGVVGLLSGHYIHLQAIHEDHIIVDDPGRWSRYNRKVRFDEARAMGYFAYRLEIS